MPISSQRKKKDKTKPTRKIAKKEKIAGQDASNGRAARQQGDSKCTAGKKLKNISRHTRVRRRPEASPGTKWTEGELRNIPPGQEQANKEQAHREPDIPERITEQMMGEAETRRGGLDSKEIQNAQPGKTLKHRPTQKSKAETRIAPKKQMRSRKN